MNSRSLLNWNSSLAATAAGSAKKCTNGQTKVIWLPFSGSHKKKKRIFRKQNIFYLESGVLFRGKLGRPWCRPRWDTHLNSRSLLNWNSSLAATAAGSVKKCTNGQTKTIWLPFSGSHKKNTRWQLQAPAYGFPIKLTRDPTSKATAERLRFYNLKKQQIPAKYRWAL